MATAGKRCKSWQHLSRIRALHYCKDQYQTSAWSHTTVEKHQNILRHFASDDFASTDTPFVFRDDFPQIPKACWRKTAHSSSLHLVSTRIL